MLNIKIVHTPYEPSSYFKAVEGYENLGEKSYRCFLCYKLRLINCFNYAKENNFEFFTTTLSISPHKNSDMINEIGFSLESDEVKFLYSNFKKDMGYLNSIKLSKEYNLYRQEYCGCIYSKEV